MKIRDMVLVGTFAALTAVGAFIRIPFFPVPFTLQLFFVMMAGILLGPTLGALSQFIYVLIGFLGFPVFAGGGGPGYVLMPSFGYLIGFIVCAYVVGLVYNFRKKPTYLWLVLSMLAGLAALYLIGITGLYLNLKYVVQKPLPLIKTIWVGMIIFLPGDIVKVSVAAYLSKDLLPRIRK
ncbi:biotin transporter BioY [Candidatus Margulisiibacteriota bacterium]